MAREGPRALITDTELDILLEEKDVTEDYYNVVVTRVRNRIRQLEDTEIEALENHGELAEQLREAICNE